MMSPNPHRWTSLVPVSTTGDRSPLFYATSYLIDVDALRHLAAELSDERPLYALHPQGLTENGGKPHETIEEMAAHYIEEMKTVQPEGPYLVGGHSSGSRIAFEVARQLEVGGDSVTGALIVDLGPPNVERPAISKRRYIWSRLRHYGSDGRLWYALRFKLRVAAERVLVRQVGGEEAKQVAEVKAAHYAAHAGFRGGSVDCDLVLIRTEETLSLPDSEWYLKWEEKTSGRLLLPEPVVGVHSALLNPPNVEQFAATMRSAIAELEVNAGVGPDDA